MKEVAALKRDGELMKAVPRDAAAEVQLSRLLHMAPHSAPSASLNFGWNRTSNNAGCQQLAAENADLFFFRCVI